MDKCNSTEHDYRKYDRIWQRVAPELDPYPAVRAAAAQEAQELALPGAQSDPCCMGSLAAQETEVIGGFIDEELADRRTYLFLQRRAPNAEARRAFRELAEEEFHHARQMMAVYYLITGECYQPMVQYGGLRWTDYCAALRDRYHAETCGGFNYIRAADATEDTCLAEIWRQMSEDEYRHADRLLQLLSRQM